MDWNEARQVVDGGLRAQLFRPVAMERLSESGSLDFQNLPQSVTAIFAGANSTTYWSEIGEQLAILKRLGAFLGGVYLKTVKHRLCVTVVLGFGAPPLNNESWEKKFEYVWPILKNLEPLIEKFKLPEPTRQLADQFVTLGAQAFGLGDPISAAVTSWVMAMIDLHQTSSGPDGFTVGIATGGVDEKLTIEGRLAYKRNDWNLSGVPSLDAFVWDVMTGGMHWGSISPQLDPNDLTKSIQGLA